MIQSFFLLIAAIAGFVLLVRVLMTVPPATLARYLRNGGGFMLLAIAAGFALLRQFLFAVPLAFLGFVILRRGGFGGAKPASGGTSRVQSAGLDMQLDHDTGEMNGRVLAGRHEGALLSDLDLEKLLEVAEDFRDDPESLSLLEGYLDRTFPRWRDDVE
ncbi:MAG TPA: molecular chaperone DnaJ, partial [Afifellaceae bacterium]|nr:molecular chaperone DnaJ [Afifellaceae bacterium]